MADFGRAAGRAHALRTVWRRGGARPAPAVCPAAVCPASRVFPSVLTLCPGVGVRVRPSVPGLPTGGVGPKEGAGVQMSSGSTALCFLFGCSLLVDNKEQ